MARPTPPPAAGAPGAVRGLVRRRWWRQFTTLCRRYLAVLASDRRTVALLVLQAPVLGLLMLWRLPSGELGPPPENTLRLLSSASIVIFNLVIGATWIGMSSAAREIVRELPQFRRERAAGLSLSAYLASKVVVLGAITILQIIVYVLIATAAQHGPNDAVALGSGRLEPAVDVAVAAFAGMCLGLLISAAARTSEQAMTVLPVVLIAQMRAHVRRGVSRCLRASRSPASARSGERAMGILRRRLHRRPQPDPGVQQPCARAARGRPRPAEPDRRLDHRAPPRGPRAGPTGSARGSPTSR